MQSLVVLALERLGEQHFRLAPRAFQKRSRRRSCFRRDAPLQILHESPQRPPTGGARDAAARAFRELLPARGQCRRGVGREVAELTDAREQLTVDLQLAVAGQGAGERPSRDEPEASRASAPDGGGDAAEGDPQIMEPLGLAALHGLARATHGVSPELPEVGGFAHGALL